METEKKQSKSSTPRSKVWASLSMTTLGVVASLLSAWVGTADILNVSKEWGTSVAAAIATVALSGGFTGMLAHRERGSARIGKLKDDMSSAYLGALEDSPLNPLRGGLR
ncbi:MAG: hypothetical protein JSW39_11930 [Desulfobacterales bacterium]|nr:MAG: hypothetical protein JSW39_11930 [Desulfobacterales bacterium]